jgi:hypothetical protein
VRDDAVRSCRLVQATDRVHRTTELEASGRLQVLAFEEGRDAGEAVDVRASVHRRAQRAAWHTDARRGSTNRT